MDTYFLPYIPPALVKGPWLKFKTLIIRDPGRIIDEFYLTGLAYSAPHGHGQA